jgi:hypothetical protein
MTFRAGESGNSRGRPKGAINRRSKAYLEEAQRRGVAPLEVLIGVMEHFMRRARSAEKRDGYMIEVRNTAQMAAPYMHAKLRQVEVTGTVEPNVEDMTDQELALGLIDALDGLGISIPPEVRRVADTPGLAFGHTGRLA